MADPNHLEIIRSGADEWNQWRKKNEAVVPSLWEADLSGTDLCGANLRQANLSRADLSGAYLLLANLRGANLTRANLSRANLSQANAKTADLSDADLSYAILSETQLQSAMLFRTNLNLANIERADLSDTTLFETIFSDSNLTGTKGLDKCRHLGASVLDYRTLAQSGPLPLNFRLGIPHRLLRESFSQPLLARLGCKKPSGKIPLHQIFRAIQEAQRWL